MSAGSVAERDRVIEHLGLEPHPEGGWFRRTWTATDPGGDPGVRAGGSSILFLVDRDVRTRWHRIDATESWQHAAGAPVRLALHTEGVPGVRQATLGPALFDGEVPQVVVEPHVWQSARTLGSWTLVVCVVVPEFTFEGFELAPEGWSPPG